MITNKTMEKKKFKDLKVGDKVYMLTESSYEVAGVNTTMKNNDNQIVIGLEIESDEMEFAVNVDKVDGENTGLWRYIEDYEKDMYLTTNKEEAVAFYDGAIKVATRLMNTFKN